MHRCNCHGLGAAVPKAWVGRAVSPLQSRARPAPTPTPSRTMTSGTAPRRIAPKTTVQPLTQITYYDPSRVIDREKLVQVDKLIDDPAPSFRDEQGEQEISPSGSVGPRGPIFREGAIAPETATPAQDWAKPALLALAAFLLLRG